MSPRHYLLALLCISIVAFSPRAEAQFSGFVFFGGADFMISDESTMDPMAGLSVQIDVAHNVTPGPISIRPTLEYFILGSRRMQTYQVNLDVVAQLASSDSYLRPFAGVGAAYGMNIDEADSGNTFGGSLVGGVELGFGQVTPMVQTRFSVVDRPHLSLILGVVFRNAPGDRGPSPNNGRPGWY